MKSINVRNLQHHSRAVLDEVSKGETIEITRRNETVARLIPPNAKKSPAPGSEKVIALAGREKQLPFTQLQDLEIRNAIRAQLGRELISRVEHDLAIAALDEDLAANRLKAVKIDWQSVWSQAEQLSSSNTADILCRTLDILHVAAALTISCTRFITGDKRQAALAEKTGLSIVELPST